MTKFAYQNISYNPAKKFRSGPKPGSIFNSHSSILAWWNLTEKTIEATSTSIYESLDFVDNVSGKLLSFSAIANRSHVSNKTPSATIATNTPLFQANDIASLTDSSFSFCDDNNDKPFSVSFWARSHVDPGVDTTVIGKFTSGGNYEWLIYFDGGQIPTFRLKDSGGNIHEIAHDNAGTNLDSQWAHYAFTYSGTEQNNKRLTLYTDGISRVVDTTPGAYTKMTQSSAPFSIGDLAGGFSGYLSDVVIFSTELTANDVSALYNAKDGTYIRTRTYDNKGSTAKTTDGIDIDNLREGVNIRHGEDLATSMRMKIHSSLRMKKLRSGSVGKDNEPYDDTDNPITCADMGSKASTTLTISGGAIDLNAKITLISTNAVTKTYIGVTNAGAIANGKLLISGDNPDGAGAIVAGDSRIFMIAVQVGDSAITAANNFQTAINHANGHNTGNANSKIAIVNNGAGILRLTQAIAGLVGNTTVTESGDISNRIAISNFTGGKVPGTFYGVLDASKGKSGYTTTLVHQIEPQDFGVFNRHQDGTAFNDNVFDSPQKILEDVRVFSGASNDRHLRVYIGETPNELYNSTDVYDKEARVDIFNRHIELRSVITDLRDEGKDSIRRSRRLTRSGSCTLPMQQRGISAESNCIQINDMRYNDFREASIPFHELYSEGDISTPLNTTLNASYTLLSGWYFNYTHENMNLGYTKSKYLKHHWPLNRTVEGGLYTPNIANSSRRAAFVTGKEPSIDIGDTPSTKIQANSVRFNRTGADNSSAYHALEIYRTDDVHPVSSDRTKHTPMSVSFWFKEAARPGTFRYLVVKISSANKYQWGIMTNVDNLLWSIHTGDGLWSRQIGVTYDFGSLDTSSWHHVLATYDGSGLRSGMKIYLNGVHTPGNSGVVNGAGVSLASEADAGGEFALRDGTPITVGSGRTANSYGFDGNIADLAMWNTELNKIDVSSMFQAASNRIFTVSTDHLVLSGSRFRHKGIAMVEHVLSQSSGPRHTGGSANEYDPTYVQNNEAYGTYMQSTVDTFYGLAGADKLQGRTFTARYRTNSADRPYHDTSKEDLVPTLINTSNDEAFVSEVKTLYMTGTSVHEGGLTGYNLATAGFQGDTGMYNRDSLVYLGLKRN